MMHSELASTVADLIQPFMQQQNERIDRLEQLVAEQQKTIESLRQEIETLKPPSQRPKSNTVLQSKAQPVKITPSAAVQLPKPQDLTQTFDEKAAKPIERKDTAKDGARRSTIVNKPTEPKEPETRSILSQRRSTQIISQQSISVIKEAPVKTSTFKPDAKKSTQPEVRGMKQSKSSKDLHKTKRDDPPLMPLPETPKVIDKGAIKAKKQMQISQSSNTSQIDSQTATPITTMAQLPNFDQPTHTLPDPTNLLEKLEIEIENVNEFIGDGDVDLLADDPLTRKESENHVLPKQFEGLLQLCRSNFKAGIVLNELAGQQQHYKALAFELEVIRDAYLTQLQSIDVEKVYSQKDGEQQGEWMSEWAKSSIDLISNGFIEDLIDNQHPDDKILDVFELCFIVLQRPFTRESNPEFWAFVKRYLKESEKDFDQKLLGLQHKEFTIYQLMVIEDLIIKYPHVCSKESYEEIDALSGVLAFIFADLVEFYGLDRRQPESSARKGYLFEKSAVIRNRIKELESLIEQLKQSI